MLIKFSPVNAASLRSFALVLAVGALSSGCGVWIETRDDDAPAPSGNVHHNMTPTNTPRDVPSRLKVSGYVLNAFEVTVDGESYVDLEDFYTRELPRLGERVRDAGFDESWEVSFAADVGFSDLWSNMTVYVATTEDRGFQARTWVDSAGGFSAEFPAEARTNTFRIRAIKRLRLLLQKDDEQRIVCYNFSAIEKAVPFAESDKPVVLSDFTTQVTAYDCRMDANNGLIVPENPRGDL